MQGPAEKVDIGAGIGVMGHVVYVQIFRQITVK